MQVVNNKSINDNFFILDLKAPVDLPEILPGQFAQILVDGSQETFLRRPFSFYDVDYNKNIIKLLIQVAGKGTMKLKELRQGDYVNTVFPLGNSFTMPTKGERTLIIGGGVGIAPFLFFARKMVESGSEPEILLGFRSSERVIEYDQFRKFGKVYITTEDGSQGEKGYVTGHSILGERFDRIYCCGPDPMMKAVARLAKKSETFCEVSLENLMACGFGICLCCIEETTRGNLCTCTEGPVFNVNELKW